MPTQNPYEQIRYPGTAFAQTHPVRLATMAALFGLTPVPVERARVLEIGCCDGGNLIPMAFSFPDSEFVGIDLTEGDIATAMETVSGVGLKNIRFEVRDLVTLPGPLGKFDYIIAHGVYSWIPPAVRDRFLTAIKASLSPNGVAYVSYNAMPGGHFRMMFRDMMLYHTRDIEDPHEKLRRARELVQFLIASAGVDSDYRKFLIKETELMTVRPDFGLFHDELSDFYQPFYFSEFLDYAGQAGLQYLAEANYFEMFPSSNQVGQSPFFQQFAGDPVRQETYVDFVRCRRFRQTLLCHDSLKVERSFPSERLKGFFFASPARSVSLEGDHETFHGPSQAKASTAHPVARRLMNRLISAWPETLTFHQLLEADSDTESVCEILLAVFRTGLIEVRISPPKFTLNPGERPCVSPLARWQANHSLPIATLRHVCMMISGQVENTLLSLLDGTRTRAEIREAMRPLLSTEKSDAELDAELEISLDSLARLCVMVS